MIQSEKCDKSSKDYLNKKDVDMAIFYNNASLGYKIKKEKRTIYKDDVNEL